jgi:hypothetical protein
MAALVMETLTTTVILEWLVWFRLGRVVVWPPAPIICATLGDIIAHYNFPFALPQYLFILILRSTCLNTTLWTLPWYPQYAREMWPTLLQTAVQLVCIAHAPRQNRLMRARWAAQLARREHAQ